MEGVSVIFPMRGQNFSLFFQNPLMIFTLGRDKTYPTGKFPASVYTGRIVMNSPEMFP